MTPPNHSPSSPEPSATPGLRLLPAPRPRDWDELTPEVARLICDVIRQEGIADHLAAALLFVSRAAFERWRAEDGGFALALEEARARFELGLMRTIRTARKSNGEPDWRAQVWLLKNATAEGIVKPARAVKRPAVQASASAQKGANLPETPEAPAHPAAGARENAANLPESRFQAPLTRRIPVEMETRAIRPETLRTSQAA